MADVTVQGDAEDRISRDRRNLREARVLIELTFDKLSILRKEFQQ